MVLPDSGTRPEEHLAWVERIISGDVRSAGRLMRHIDDDTSTAHQILELLFPHTGRARILGVTGNPGSGKSTLVNRLIEALRHTGQTVGCVAVDPTSPFSGGAILGDRVRMQEHALDAGVFIRSVATRGNLGGISRSTPAILSVLDAMGFDWLIVETVGVGQDEVDIVQLADTTLVVAVPGLGDEVQASKAGILEIADIFVLNKADLPSAAKLRRELKSMLELAPKSDSAWQVPLCDTVAIEGRGVDQVLEKITEHQDWLEQSGQRQALQRQRLSHYSMLCAQGIYREHMMRESRGIWWQETLESLQDRRITPEEAARQLVRRFVDQAEE